jgi:mannose-6-phosphate isomerase-like protein (cupin superfamily)
MDAIVTPPGEAVAANGAVFALHEWNHGPNAGPRLHVHHHDDEAWYVLEGTLRFRIGDETIDVVAGGSLFCPAGVPHSFGNPGPGDARYLIFMTNRIHDLIKAMHEPGADAAEVSRRFDSEIVE